MIDFMIIFKIWTMCRPLMKFWYNYFNDRSEFLSNREPDEIDSDVEMESVYETAMAKIIQLRCHFIDTVERMDEKYENLINEFKRERKLLLDMVQVEK